MSIQSSGASIAAPHPTIANLWVRETDSQSGLILTGYCHGAMTDTTAGTYEHGAMMVQTDASSGITIFVNTGTTASPSWTSIGSLPPGDIALPDGQILVGNSSGVAAAVNAGKFAVSVLTNGATPVNVFGATNGFGGTITNVISTAQDTTAGNITLATNAGAVASNIIKGTAVGGMAGTAMTATAFTAGGTATVVSSSGGNSIVTVTFTVA